jgi:hypothetical protein
MDNFLILHNVKTKNIGLVKNKIESLKNLGPGKLIVRFKNIGLVHDS